MTVRETAPTIARKAAAEQRLLVIKNALEVADMEIGRALAERDWEVFGLASFEEYCAEKLPELEHIKLRVAARRARTKALLDADPAVTERGIAAATGASAATAHRDRLAVTGHRPASNEASVTAADQPVSGDVANGVNFYPISHTPKKPASRVSIILRMAGEGPLTVASLKKATGWGHEVASPALSRLAASKRLTYTPGAKRGQMGSYSLPA